MATNNQMYYTQEGYDELVNELNYLKNTRRAEVVHDIEVARGFGDLSENAEYDEARTEQARVEARIKELEEKVRNAIIIDEKTIDTNVISVGSTVKVFDRDIEEEEEYIIVGSNEVAPSAHRISDLSPIGRALMGKHAGEVAVIDSPGGSFEMEIISVVRTKNEKA